MNLFVFSSSNLTNIWAGIGSGRWAVSVQQGKNASIQAKAKNFPIGALGLFYCVESQSLTTPFLVCSKPEFDVEVVNIWPEPWVLPFDVIPLGSPERQLAKGRLAEVLPSVRSGIQWNKLLHFQPITVFAPSVITEEDWSVLTSELAEF